MKLSEAFESFVDFHEIVTYISREDVEKLYTKEQQAGLLRVYDKIGTYSRMIDAGHDCEINERDVLCAMVIYYSGRNEKGTRLKRQLRAINLLESYDHKNKHTCGTVSCPFKADCGGCEYDLLSPACVQKQLNFI